MTPTTSGADRALAQVLVDEPGCRLVSRTIFQDVRGATPATGAPDRDFEYEEML